MNQSTKLDDASLKALISLAEKRPFPGANNKPVWAHLVFTVEESTGLTMDPTTVKVLCEELLARREIQKHLSEIDSTQQMLGEIKVFVENYKKDKNDQ